MSVDTKPRFRVQASSVRMSTSAVEYVPRGRVRAMSDSYIGLEAGRFQRRMSSFMPTRSHVNTLISQSGPTILARARYLVRNNGYAANAVGVYASALVGIGIYPTLASLTKKQKKVLHKKWKKWCKEADSEGLTDFYGLQSRIAQELMIANECFVRFRYRRVSDGFVVPMQLQMIPSEQLDVSYTVDLGKGIRVRQGIEFNPIGKRTAYWFWKENPGDLTTTTMSGNERVRVPAEEVMHIIDPVEAGQIRGLSKFTAAVVKIWTLDQYDDAELERKKTAALFTGFVTHPDPEGKFFDEDGDNAGAEDAGSDTGAANVSLEPGSMHVLDVGEDVKFTSPAESGQSYEPFQYRTLLSICSALGLPYFKVTGDLIKANYSSLRAGLIELKRRIERTQYSVMVQLFCQPVWNKWFEQGMLNGSFEDVIQSSDYIENRDDYEDVNWLPPPWEWVDPEKDVDAAVKAIDAKLTSRSAVIRSQGGEPEEVDEEIAEDQKRADKLGISKPASMTAKSKKEKPSVKDENTPIDENAPVDDNEEGDEEKSQ